MVTNLIRPSYKTGFVRNASESKRPNLWRSLVLASKPSLGISGLTLRDQSRFRNNGTLQNMTIDDWVIGNNPRLPGYALDLDGSNDFIDMGNHSSLDLVAGGVFTISGWFKMTKASGATYQRMIFRNVNGNTNTYQFDYGTSGATDRFIMSVFKDAGEDVSGTSGTTFGEWHHIAAVWVDALGTVFMYHNGILDSSTAGGAAFGVSSNLLIGKRSDDVGGTFTGAQMDNILIHDRALLASEILDLYQNPNAMFEFADRGISRGPIVGGDTLLISVADCVEQNTLLV